MSELELKDASISFGAGALLDHVDLVIERGERVGLLGRNGAGKTTLMRVLTGDLELDEGVLVMRPGLIVTRLEQEVPANSHGTVEELVRRALVGRDLDDWEIDKRLERELERFELDRDAKVDELSAGMKRRALLASAMIVEPDLLILDEPTNHLELDAIARLEVAMLRRRGSLLFVTHDRAFLRNLATRILDLDRGNLSSYECDYTTYLDRKASDMAAESKRDSEFDKHLAKEEVWIRQGVQARRTRNMGRVRSLIALREERAARRGRTGEARAKIQQAERSGRLVLRATGLTFSYGPKKIVSGLDFELLRGDRVGILGPNGAGKSTLLALLLDELKAGAGDVRHGTKLEVARFDQLHGTLNPERSVSENVAGEADMVFIDGRPRHVISYLSDFLFTPDQVRGSITKLSGGEKNRLQLAAILAQPCNLLVLDEPTNDLDLETLELLEELLSGYKGTLLLVSHDREFLENVVTSVLVHEGPGEWREYLGGYEDWQRAAKERQRVAIAAAAEIAAKAARKQAPAPKPARARRLTFTEAHELKGLPDAIEALEAKKAALIAAQSVPDYYRRPQPQQAADRKALKALEAELETKVDRWDELGSLES